MLAVGSLTEDDGEVRVVLADHTGRGLETEQVHRTKTRLVGLLDTIAPPHEGQEDVVDLALELGVLGLGEL